MFFEILKHNYLRPEFWRRTDKWLKNILSIQALYFLELPGHGGLSDKFFHVENVIFANFFLSPHFGEPHVYL